MVGAIFILWTFLMKQTLKYNKRKVHFGAKNQKDAFINWLWLFFSVKLKWLWVRCDGFSSVSILKHLKTECLYQSYLAVKFPHDISVGLLCVKLSSCPCAVINIKANVLTCSPKQLSLSIEVYISPGTHSLKILHTWATTSAQQQGFFQHPAHENPCPFIFMNSQT